MKELSFDRMEKITGEMSEDCGWTIASWTIATVGLAALTGGVGILAVTAMAGRGIASISFMRACGPSDFY
ncbi:hypothetical protein DN752_16760 [Echinicola strongylocentroti]|uniref:Uncharacterized protein n=1 Tax=Echinicola strongylocentroti TaxID=1795355 RepID=A0A2Z4IL81_9BACT|nr:hypothetical protein [Echinicola strongylocentroti]AWW31644.1 hypothetical protein DN752_16760 [Echinicola strongylocentroti]